MKRPTDMDQLKVVYYRDNFVDQNGKKTSKWVRIEGIAVKHAGKTLYLVTDDNPAILTNADVTWVEPKANITSYRGTRTFARSDNFRVR